MILEVRNPKGLEREIVEVRIPKDLRKVASDEWRVASRRRGKKNGRSYQWEGSREECTAG